MDRNINLYQYITLWLDLFKKNEVKAGTFERLIQSSESIGKYPIGLEKVSDVTALDVQYYINTITQEGYSFSTIKKQLELLRASLRKAVSLKLISSNPADEIGMPNKNMIKKPKEVLAYDEQEQRKIQQYRRAPGHQCCSLCGFHD